MTRTILSFGLFVILISFSLIVFMILILGGKPLSRDYLSFHAFFKTYSHLELHIIIKRLFDFIGFCFLFVDTEYLLLYYTNVVKVKLISSCIVFNSEIFSSCVRNGMIYLVFYFLLDYMKEIVSCTGQSDRFKYSNLHEVLHVYFKLDI